MKYTIIFLLLIGVGSSSKLLAQTSSEQSITPNMMKQLEARVNASMKNTAAITIATTQKSNSNTATLAKRKLQPEFEQNKQNAHLYVVKKSNKKIITTKREANKEVSTSQKQQLKAVLGIKN